METDQIIKQLDSFQAKLFVRDSGVIVPADPVTLANNLLLIRGLLIQLVDKVAKADLEFKKTRAAKFHALIEKGVKKSPAADELKMDDELIQFEVIAEQIRNYMRYCDGLCTSIQSVLKVQSSSDKSSY